MGLPFPEEYGGAGRRHGQLRARGDGDRRADASTAITLAAHVSLGASPFYLFGTEEQKQRYLVPLARGEKLWGFGLTEPQRRQRRRRHANARRAARRPLDHQRHEGLHHQQRHRHHRRDDDHRRHRHRRATAAPRSRTSSSRRTRPVHPQQEVREDGLARVRHARALVRRRERPRREPARRARQRAQAVPHDPRRRPDLGRRALGRARDGRLRRGAQVREGASAVRAADLEVPGDPVQARRHAHGDRARQADGAQSRLGEGQRARLRADRELREALLRRDVAPGRQRGGADPRRLRIHGRVSGLAHVSRPEDQRDRRRHQRGPAPRDRAPDGA